MNQIIINEETKKDLKILVAELDFKSYDEVIRYLYEIYLKYMEYTNQGVDDDNVKD